MCDVVFQSDAEAAREAYDTFLSHYPYCYGYWRKYADYEKRKGIKANCYKVSTALKFRRAIKYLSQFFVLRLQLRLLLIFIYLLLNAIYYDLIKTTLNKCNIYNKKKIKLRRQAAVKSLNRYLNRVFLHISRINWRGYGIGLFRCWGIPLLIISGLGIHIKMVENLQIKIRSVLLLKRSYEIVINRQEFSQSFNVRSPLTVVPSAPIILLNIFVSITLYE